MCYGKQLSTVSYQGGIRLIMANHKNSCPKSKSPRDSPKQQIFRQHNFPPKTALLDAHHDRVADHHHAAYSIESVRQNESCDVVVELLLPRRVPD